MSNKEKSVEEAVEEKEIKELKIRPVRDGAALFEIYYENGGELPQELTGYWTEKHIAETAVNKYLVSKGRK